VTTRLLQVDNFTPTSRTPWGGTRICAELKRDLIAPPRGLVVGESWEFSVEPDFPSHVYGTEATLAEWIASDPSAILGREADGRGGTALLVKLLDAADELSVQIHPSDSDPLLGAGESGKPECWYAVAADPGAGVYLGLAEGVSREALGDALRSGADVSRMLRFVPVEVGDFLLIEAGTAHAIGRGLTLVEPQRVLPGCRGLTYRYWDWNRRYDASGRADPAGRPRALHVDEALAVTRWDAPRGAALLATCRVRGGRPDLSGAAEFSALCGRDGGLPSEHLQVARIHGTGELDLPDWGALRAITVVDGAVTIDGVTVSRGQSAAVAASGGVRRASLRGAHAIISAVY
jgi:mannose-6-phosphate isomerase class I